MNLLHWKLHGIYFVVVHVDVVVAVVALLLASGFYCMLCSFVAVVVVCWVSWLLSLSLLVV